MGIFNENKNEISKVNKIEVIKEKEGNKIEYVLDCSKLKNSIHLFENIIGELNSNNCAWLLIDTSFIYPKSRKKVVIKEAEVIEFLDERSIPYLKSDKLVKNSTAIMGIPLRAKNEAKVERFDIGMKITPEVLGIANHFYENFSLFCYISNRTTEFEEILNVHNNKILNQEKEIYSYEKEASMDWFQGFIYADDFYKRIRVASESEITAMMDNILTNYKE